MKEQFSHHGIPDVLISNNGPRFTRREFSQFATQWEFQHVTSSPYHPKSNGKAESAVKVVKNLFKKAQRDNKDPWLSLLDYRNTPTTGMQTRGRNKEEGHGKRELAWRNSWIDRIWLKLTENCFGGTDTTSSRHRKAYLLTNQNLYHSQLWRAMQPQQLLLLQAQQYEEQAPEILSGQQDLQTTFAKTFALQLNFIRLFYVL